MKVSAPDTTSVLRALEEHGLLLQHDAALPSVTRLVAGESVRGSWWSHGAGARIYRALAELDELPARVLFVRLISGKVTLVDRALHPAILSIAGEQAPWQLATLSGDARALLDRVRDAGSDRIDPIPGAAEKIGALALELEKRLLVHGRSEHTDQGTHAKVLETWSAWSERHGVSPDPRGAAASRAELEARIARWGIEPRGLVPWLPKRSRGQGASTPNAR
jgi:hypothetical protein